MLVARLTPARSTPGEPRQCALDGAGAGGARHAGDGQIHAIGPRARSCRHFVPELPHRVGQSLGLHFLRVVFHRGASPWRSTVALITPGVAESFRSTPRAQLPQVIPRIVMLVVWRDIPI